MGLAVGIVGLLSALAGVYLYVDKKYFSKTPAEKAIDIMNEAENAFKKGKDKSDTKDIEDLIND